MQWSHVRHQYPDQWLLVEAVQAHSEGDQRILDDLAVIQRFSDSPSALAGYQALHQAEPGRELYVVHSSREVLAIRERPWVGIRVAR